MKFAIRLGETVLVLTRHVRFAPHLTLPQYFCPLVPFFFPKDIFAHPAAKFCHLEPVRTR